MSLSNIQQLLDFTGKTVIVTGAGKGIGEAIALEFANAGADVVVAARTKSDLDKVVDKIKAMGRRGLAVPTDVTKVEAIDNLIQTTLKEFGKIDVLVNNAGHSPMKNVLNVTEEDWYYNLDLNLKSAFFCCQAVGTWWIQQKRGGRIVNISSLESHTPFARGVIPYEAAKAGVNMMTKALAKEWAYKGIYVNCVAPGSTNTEGTRQMAAAVGISVEEYKRMASVDVGICMGRPGEPEEMAYAVLFLSSDAANYITGQVLYVEGGALLGKAWKIKGA